MLTRQQAPGRTGASCVSVAPEAVLPIGDSTRRVERGAGLRHHCGSKGFPCELLLTHPLQPDRVPGDMACDQCRVGGSIIGAVVAVTAGAFHVDATYLVRWKIEHFGNRLSVGIDALRMRPHRQVSVPELRDRARRTYRGVRDVRARKGRLDRGRYLA